MKHTHQRRPLHVVACRGAPEQAKKPFRLSQVVALVLRMLVLFPLIALPWAFGGVHSTPQAVLSSSLVVAVGGLLILYLLGNGSHRKYPLPAPIPLGLLVASLCLGALQLAPFPRPLLDVLSPESVRLHEALGGIDAPITSANGWTITLDPAATRSELSLLATLALCFAFGGLACCRRSVVPWVLGLVAANGTAFVFFGLIQRLSWNGLLYWRFPSVHGGMPFAAYVNRNNGGGYLNLCLAAALGLLIWHYSQSRAKLSERHLLTNSLTERWFRGPQSWFHELSSRAGNVLSALDTLSIAAAVLVIVLGAGVIASLSRGAMVSLAVAALVTVALVVRTHRNVGFILGIALLLLGSGVLVFSVGLDGEVWGQIETVTHGDALRSDGRWAHWQDGLRAAGRFPWAGSGLGTYRWIYGLVEQHVHTFWFQHAENQYVEAVTTAGLVGLLLLLALLALTVHASWQLVGTSLGHPRRFAVGVAGVFAITSQAVHAFTDFGLYLSANGGLLALLAGMVVGFRSHHPATHRRDQQPTSSSQRVSLALLAILVAAGSWASWELTMAARTELATIQSRFTPSPFPPRPGSRGELDLGYDGDTLFASQVPTKWRVLAAIDRLERALKSRPDDGDARLQLVETRLLLYRLRAFGILAAGGWPVSEAELWNWTSPPAIHAAAHSLAEDQQELTLLYPDEGNVLPQVLDDLLVARRHTPLRPVIHLRIAQLALAAGRPDEEIPSFQRAMQAGSNQPQILDLCGIGHLSAGRLEEAAACFRVLLQRQPMVLGQLQHLLSGQMELDFFARHVLPDDPELLVRFALSSEMAAAAQADVQRELYTRAERLLLNDSTLAWGPRLSLLGSVYHATDRPVLAFEAFSQAVRQIPGDADAHLGLARAALSLGRRHQARRHAEIGQSLAPDRRDIQTFLESLPGDSAR